MLRCRLATGTLLVQVIYNLRACFWTDRLTLPHGLPQWCVCRYSLRQHGWFLVGLTSDNVPRCVSFTHSFLTHSILRGRRKVCLLFCITTIAALCLRLMEIYPILIVSHILSGASTALMYSVFESWYVSEHTTRGYPADWRSRTFATSTFLNGLVAIIAGLVANQLVDFWGVGAPYVFAMVLLGFAGFMISTTWTENYGEAQGNVSRHSGRMKITGKDLLTFGFRLC